MSEFLTLLPPKEALKLWMSAFDGREILSEEINILQALGRVTTKPVIAPHELPEFPRSTMDGYAVRAADTYGAGESLPAYLTVLNEVPMGKQPEFKLSPTQAALIHTGGMLPEGANAVVMLENTQSSRKNEIEVLRAVAPSENIIRPGEDVEKGQEVIPGGKRLRPAEIGGLAALGIATISVALRPRIAIISSGDEVIPLDVSPLPGQVRDVNSYSLNALIEEKGAIPVRMGIVPDDPVSLGATLRKAIQENDAIIITAGSSASARDLTSQVINEVGKPGVLVHGVNVRPGKPTILAVCGSTPVIGLPGNPVSALVIAMLFVTPLVERLLGILHRSPTGPLNAKLCVNIASQAGREDWIPVKINGDSSEYQADPIFFKSNLIFNLSEADGLLYIPPDVTGFSVGENVEIYPF